mmetsp:Transcript_16882/g.24791  ORF Transcript_16882/g.24791 Transcript_16882/m.24791 type:complete len:101 (-) Transcript_16882:1514-1816(-)
MHLLKLEICEPRDSLRSLHCCSILQVYIFAAHAQTMISFVVMAAVLKKASIGLACNIKEIIDGIRIHSGLQCSFTLLLQIVEKKLISHLQNVDGIFKRRW